MIQQQAGDFWFKENDNGGIDVYVMKGDGNWYPLDEYHVGKDGNWYLTEEGTTKKPEHVNDYDRAMKGI